MATTKEIEKTMRKKARQIRKFADAKSQSIAISSAFNGAAQIVTALLSTGKIEAKDYWKEHDKWYQEYLDRFLEEQNQGKEQAKAKTKAGDLKEFAKVIKRKPKESDDDYVARLTRQYTFWRNKDEDRSKMISEAILKVETEDELPF